MTNRLIELMNQYYDRYIGIIEVSSTIPPNDFKYSVLSKELAMLSAVIILDCLFFTTQFEHVN